MTAGEPGSLEARPPGEGWKASCPAHQDTTQSLIVSKGHDGRLLLRCQAGCPTEIIVAALGLKANDLLANHGARSREVVATCPSVPEQILRGSASGLTHIRDLLAEPDDPVSWIVDGLLPAGGLSIFASKPKAGKSTTARALALAVARGAPCLGRATERGPVLYLGLEDPRRVTKGHLQMLGAREDDDLYVFTGKRPAEALTWLEAMLAERDPVLVIVDTQQRLTGIRDLNDYAKVTAALEPLLDLVRPRRAHLMLLHHAGKGARTGFDSVLGSTGFVGTADVILLLRRREDDTRTITTLQRMGDDLPESIVTLSEQQEPILQGKRADFDARQVEDRVVAWLSTQDEPVTRDAVKAAVEGRAEIVLAALQRLARDGQVTRTGGGKRGDPYLFAMPFRRSLPVPGTENQKRETSDSSRNSGTHSVPANADSDENAFPQTPHPCPRCGHQKRHLGTDPSTGWVCLTCYPAASPPDPKPPTLDGM